MFSKTYAKCEYPQICIHGINFWITWNISMIGNNIRLMAGYSLTKLIQYEMLHMTNLGVRLHKADIMPWNSNIYWSRVSRTLEYKLAPWISQAFQIAVSRGRGRTALPPNYGSTAMATRLPPNYTGSAAGKHASPLSPLNSDNVCRSC